MSRALILDLDDTVVDTNVLASFRTARKWAACKSNLHRTVCFPDMREVIERVRAAQIKVGFVTRSPSNYAGSVLSHHSLPHDALVAYHDVSQQKPHPESVRLCLSRLEASAAKSLGIGDALVDAQAYRAAGLLAWGAGWSPYLQADAPWDYVAAQPALVLKHFGIS